MDEGATTVRLKVLPAPRRFAGLGLRAYRLAVLLAIVLLIHRHHQWLLVQGDAPITLAEVRALLPTAASLSLDEGPRQQLKALDRSGKLLGYAVRTSPLSNTIVGYSGPTDTLVVLSPEDKVVGIRIRSSADTREHVQDVADDGPFMSTWNGMTWDQVAHMDLREADVEGVSGATLTSMAMARGIVQRFRYATDQRPPAVRIRGDDVGLALVLAAAVLLAFSPLRGKLWLRRTLQLTVIGYLGLYSGQLLSESLFVGWARSGLPWRIAPGLALLGAAAMLVPWSTRRQLYCSHLCPHGAAQELLGRISPFDVKLPRSVAAGLRWLPPLLLALILIAVMLGLPLDLAGLEPFDAYLFRAAGWATIGVAAAGLVASLFVRQAYCKYGCPTGTLLEFLRSHGSADHFDRRDLAALGLLALAALLYFQYPALHHLVTG